MRLHKGIGTIYVLANCECISFLYRHIDCNDDMYIV